MDEFLTALASTWWVLVPGGLLTVIGAADDLLVAYKKLNWRRSLGIFLVTIIASLAVMWFKMKDARDAALLEEITPSRIYKPLVASARLATLERLAPLQGAVDSIDVHCESSDVKRQRVCQDLHALLQEAGLTKSEGPVFVTSFWSNDPRPAYYTQPSIYMTTNSNGHLLSVALAAALSQYVRYSIPLDLNDNRKENSVEIEISGDPLFFGDGSITFD